MPDGVIKKISGPLIVAEGLSDAAIYDVVLVSGLGLTGEIIEIKDGLASIQVYEETSGLAPGDIVKTLGEPLSAELGPGLIGSIYDGIQRPLAEISKKAGSRLERGVRVASLPCDKLWDFVPIKAVGDAVFGGDCIGSVRETEAVVHKIMVPPGVSGKISRIKSGAYKVSDTVCEITLENGRLRIEGEKLFVADKDGKTTEFADNSNAVYHGRSYWGTGHSALINDYYYCLKSGEKFEIDAYEGGKTAEIVLACYESSASGESIKTERK